MTQSGHRTPLHAIKTPSRRRFTTKHGAIWDSYLPVGTELLCLFRACAEYIFTEPGRLQERIIVLGIRYFEYGMRCEHVPAIKIAIMDALSECAEEQWNADTKPVVEWMLAKVWLLLMSQ